MSSTTTARDMSVLVRGWDRRIKVWHGAQVGSYDRYIRFMSYSKSTAQYMQLPCFFDWHPRNLMFPFLIFTAFQR